MKIERVNKLKFNIAMRQNFKKNNLALIILLLCFGALIVVLQSCEREDNISSLNEPRYSKHLDINTNNNTKAFTHDELMTIAEGFSRIDKYRLEINDIDYILNNKRKVSTSLNISENLFEYLLLGINFDNPINNSQIRLRSGEIESTIGINFSSRSVTLSHSETIALMNGMQTASSNIGWWGSGIAAICGQTAASFLIGGKAYLEGLQWANMEDHYLEGSQNGAVYIETTHNSPTGMSYTSYQFIY